MEIMAAAFGVIGTITDLIKQAENASQEKHAAIVAALAKADADLQAARDAARASVDADNADMQQRLRDAAPKP